MEDEGFVNFISGSGNVINFKKGQLNFFFSTPLLGKISRYSPLHWWSTYYPTTHIHLIGLVEGSEWLDGLSGCLDWTRFSVQRVTRRERKSNERIIDEMWSSWGSVAKCAVIHRSRFIWRRFFVCLFMIRIAEKERGGIKGVCLPSRDFIFIANKYGSPISGHGLISPCGWVGRRFQLDYP